MAEPSSTGGKLLRCASAHTVAVAKGGEVNLVPAGRTSRSAARGVSWHARLTQHMALARGGEADSKSNNVGSVVAYVQTWAYDAYKSIFTACLCVLFEVEVDTHTYHVT